MKGACTDLRAAWEKAQRHSLCQAARLNTERQGAYLTGVDPLNLAREMQPESYCQSSKLNKISQEPIRADSLDEPNTDAKVFMLDALEPADAFFYSSESQVVDWSNKSTAQFLELQSQYCFIGGRYHEYRKYFQRQNIPKDMWTFYLPTEAVAGFSAVPKKTQGAKRKLLMACATNYAWTDPKGHRDHGLHGGGALGKAFVSSDR